MGKKRNISLAPIIITPPIIIKNFIEIKEAKPSRPSIKFMAFTIIKNTKRVTTIESQYGISKTPKTP
jgi:hypothetical protein